VRRHVDCQTINCGMQKRKWASSISGNRNFKAHRFGAFRNMTRGNQKGKQANARRLLDTPEKR
jgi:hypothetical protein